MENHIKLTDAQSEFYKLLDMIDAGLTPHTFKCIRDLRSAAMRLSNLAEKECNGVIGPDGFAKWDDNDQEKNDKAILRAANRVVDAVSGAMDSESFAKVQIEFQGDPRGPSVILHIKDGPQRVACFW